MKEEALVLVDLLENFDVGRNLQLQASAMIRRLVEELDEKNYRILELTKRYKALTWNDKQGEPVAWWSGKSKFCSPRDKSWDAKTGGILSFGCNIPLYTTPQTKPLSDEEIIKVFEGNFNPNSDGTINSEVLAFARAIEERHGIK